MVSLCNIKKTPGPDGFNFSFFKRFWTLLRDDLGVMFSQFHHFATLPHNVSSFFVTLMPKVDSPSQLGDFRPIYLVGSLYKIISNVLVSRLPSVMDTLISFN